MKSSLHIFVLLAFLTGILAPACGFAWGGKYSVVEICTSQGIESRIVEGEEQDHSPTINEDCAFCFASANLKNFLPHDGATERVHFNADKIRFRTYETVYLSRISKSGQPRAPPSLV